MNLNKGGYDFHFGPGKIKQEDAILSIVEGRLVPRNLSGFEDLSGSQADTFIYVDNSGEPKKLALLDITTGSIKVVDEEPAIADENQIIFKRISDNKYVIEQYINGEWKHLHIMSDADIINFDPNDNIEAHNVQDAIVEVDDKFLAEAERLQNEINKKQDIINEDNKLNVDFVDDISIVGKTNDYNDLNNKLVDGLDIHIDADNKINFINSTGYITPAYLDDPDHKYATQKWVNEIIAGIAGGGIQIVVINEISEVKQPGIIYLIREAEFGRDTYDEYILVEYQIDSEGKFIPGTGHPELIGNTRIDLSNYYTKDESDRITNAISTALEEQVTKEATDVSVLNNNKQNKLTAGKGIIIDDDTITYDEVEISSVEYVDANISDTMRFIIQERDAEHAGRVAGDNLLQANKQDKLTAGTGITIEKDSEGKTIISSLADEVAFENIKGEVRDNAKLATEFDKKTDKEIIGANGKAMIFNESDGGGAKFVNNNGVESFIGVNDSSNGIAAQIYADRLDSEGKWIGAKLDVTNNGIYYTVGNKQASERDTQENELAVKGDVDKEANLRSAFDNTLQMNINAASIRLDNEITNRTNADNDLSDRIDEEVDTLEQSINTLSGGLEAEAQARSSKDTEIEDNLEQEIADRGDADDILDDKIDQEVLSRQNDIIEVKGLISAEETRATSKETELDTNKANITYVDSKVTQATDYTDSKVEYIEGKIEEEATRASSAEQDLAGDISNLDTTLRGLITSEETDRKEADTALNTLITTEASTRSSEDERIAGLVTAEATARSTADSNLQTNIDSAITRIETIEEVIPTQTYTKPNNELADKDFVNSSLNSIAAFYITKNAEGDAFESVEELRNTTVFYSLGQVRVPTRNDYCIVRVDEEHDNSTTRYIYSNTWLFQYLVNETPLTAAQLKAINSGITSELVAQITANQNAISSNYTELSSSISNEILNRENADIELQESIAAVEDNLDTEVARAKAAEETLTTGLNTHINNKSNPHSVTKAQVGLGNVDNTSDINKPISTATQNALNTKANATDVTALTARVTTAEGNISTNTTNISGLTSSKVDKVSGKSLISDTEINRLAGMSTGANKTESSLTNGNIKIDGAETTVYTHPAGSDADIASGFYKISTDANSHVASTTPVKESDIIGLVQYGADKGSGLKRTGSGTNYKFTETYTTITLGTTWTPTIVEEVEGYPYTQVSSIISGLTGDSKPVLDIIIPTTATAEQLDTYNEDWSKIFSAETMDNGTIVFYAKEPTTIELTVAVKGY